MNEKITLPRCVALLAASTGMSKKSCEDFLRELSQQICDSLVGGENVKIKGIGTFKLIDIEPRKSVDVSTGEDIEIEGHRKVVFVASKEIAAAINAPFEAFEAVEIAESAEEALLSDYQPSPDTQSDSIVQSDILNQETIEDETSLSDARLEQQSLQEARSEEMPLPDDYQPADNDIVYTVPADADSSNEMPDEQTEEVIENIPDEVHADEVTQEVVPVTNDVVTEFQQHEDKDDDEERLVALQPQPKKKHHRFLWGFLSGFVIGQVVILLILFIFYLYFGKVGVSHPIADVKDTKPAKESVEEIQPVTPVDSVESKENIADTQPSDSKKYDTITTKRFLTTMAKEYYGNYNLWPYIYEENKAILGHPDRIRPGTRVVIPPLSKYGVDPNNPNDIAKAKKLGVQIYAKYE